MMSFARSERTHVVTSDTNFRPLYWVATSANNGSTFFFQIVNIDESSQPLTVNIQNLKSSGTSSSAKASATILAAGPGQDVTVTNSLDNLNAVVPSVQKIKITRSGAKAQFSATVQGWSFSIFRVDL